MNVGDLVVRTYGEGARPIGLVVSRGHDMVNILWLGLTSPTLFKARYLKVISESI